MYEDWPLIEFTEARRGILSRFTTETGDGVAAALIKEIVGIIDHPETESVVQTELDLEWVMAIINHSFSLPFLRQRDYETIHSATRIYLVWMSALTTEPHASCPSALLQHPDRYFRRMLEAMRFVFMPRDTKGVTVVSNSELSHAETRQGVEMRTILLSLCQLGSRVIDDFRDEYWSQLIVFLLETNAQMLDHPTAAADELGQPHNIAAELIGALFDSWTAAAILEYVPSPSYWKTLHHFVDQWKGHVVLFEHWGRHVLPMAAIIFRQVVKKPRYGSPDIVPLKLQSLLPSPGPAPPQLVDTWFRFIHLLDQPTAVLDKISASGDEKSENLSLAFFLNVLVFVRLVDVIYGDPQVTADFHESAEAQQSWAEIVADEWKAYTSQRQSNLSVGSAISGDSMNQTASNLEKSSTTTTTTSSSMRKTTTSFLGSSSKHKAKNQNQNHSGHSQSHSVHSEEILPPGPSTGMPTSPGGASIDQTQVKKPKPSFFVYHYLKANSFHRLHRSENDDGNRQVPAFQTSAILDVFLYLLGDAAQVQVRTTPGLAGKVEDAISISQRSVNGMDLDSVPISSAALASGGGGDRTVQRRSFAQSTGSSDYSLSTPAPGQGGMTSAGYGGSSSSSSTGDPRQVDGIAAGKAAALGALCRIVCEKNSSEQLSDDQLAHFYLAIHRALVERERLSLCSIIYYGTELFKLGLTGVEILLPNFVAALDIVLTESLKLRLHPSIQEVEMRHTCLQSLASIVAWPTAFSTAPIVDESAWMKLGQGPSNALDSRPTFLDLRQRILRVLIHTLRNESDSTNLHLALATCTIFCVESCRHDQNQNSTSGTSQKLRQDSEEEEKCFAISVVRAVISAICDNIWKPQWANELVSSLAALDCLNSLSTLPPRFLFTNDDDLSTGSLIVSSLCRFVDNQLQKPPMYHSRDLHSSVVAAYASLGVWLTTVPKLTEIESSLSTVADVIEFGITGGHGLRQSEFKPASLRVKDAADTLLNIILSRATPAMNSMLPVGENDIVDERRLLYSYGPQAIDTTKFQHFVINNQSTIFSVHEASHIESISPEGQPAVVVVTRTPFSLASTTVFRLQPSVVSKIDNSDAKSDFTNSEASNVPKTPLHIAEGFQGASGDRRESFDVPEAIKQFEFPAGFEKPLCKLDEAHPAPKPSQTALGIVDRMSHISNRLQQGGGCAVGDRDASNVWIQSSLGAYLTAPPQPQQPVSKVNSIRTLLYDLGLIDETAFGTSFIPLDSGKADEFYNDLHYMLDRVPVRLVQTVGIFYVREGQHTSTEILGNSLFLDETSPEFCQLLAELGQVVDVGSHPHWTGHWATAFSPDRKPQDPNTSDRYVFDGVNHCLWWADSLLELAFVVASERTLRLHSIVSAASDSLGKELSVSAKQKSLRESNVDSAFEDDHSSSGAQTSQPSPSSLSATDTQSSQTGGPSASISRHSDVSQASSMASGSSPSKSQRTKSSSTINSECGTMAGTATWRPTLPSFATSISTTTTTTVDRTPRRSADQRVFVVWLERIEDMYHFPIDQLFDVVDDGAKPNLNPTANNSSSSTSTYVGAVPDHVVIYLHLAEPGLVRVHVDGIWTKYGQPGPLADGVVVTLGALPQLLRQTLCSIARRRCFEVDSFQSIAIRRKTAIQEFTKKYARPGGNLDGFAGFLDSFIFT